LALSSTRSRLPRYFRGCPRKRSFLRFLGSERCDWIHFLHYRDCRLAAFLGSLSKSFSLLS